MGRLAKVAMRFAGLAGLTAATAATAATATAAVAGSGLGGPSLPAVAEGVSDGGTLACAREMRKTFEALQAWRRRHGGGYPDRLVDAKLAALLPARGAVCPTVIGEALNADPSHRLLTSRGPGGDPIGTYEYELSAHVGVRREWLPTNAPPYRRADVKKELLRRAAHEQVPILRCSSHGEGADGGRGWRNLTVTGAYYGSDGYWEARWFEDVPYCCRDANVLFGLRGPPFHSGLAPGLEDAVDLRAWVTAFGDHPWWWTFPMFGEGADRQFAADLRRLFDGSHGRIAQVGGESWWLDGLVQLQGRITNDWGRMYREPTRWTTVWERTGLPVGRRFREAAWLQGTVWEDVEGRRVGELVWRYADGGTERVPIVYGRNTARFWREAGDPDGIVEAVSPVWEVHEAAAEVGVDRRVRLYRQSWVNPRPDIEVRTLDFVSDRESPASPFLVSLRLLQ